MTKAEVMTMLSTLGLPVAYHHFAEGEAPDLPYLIYHCPQSRNFSGDDHAYMKAEDLTVELYTEKRDPGIETVLESVLDSNDIFYNKSQAYIGAEDMYEIIYEAEAAVW